MLVKFKSNRLGAWYDVMIYHACCQVTSDVNLKLNWIMCKKGIYIYIYIIYTAYFVNPVAFFGIC